MRAASNKQSSPQKGRSGSLSSEELHAPPLTRRRTREQEPDEPDSPNMNDTLIDEEDEQEVTRCVCTFLEYPGPPSVSGKSKDGLLVDAVAQSDESAWFIQCDICKSHQKRVQGLFAQAGHHLGGRCLSAPLPAEQSTTSDRCGELTAS